MGTIDRTLTRLEAILAARDPDQPGYLVFADEVEYQTWMAGYTGRPVKVYIGFSPDDWDEEAPCERLNGD